MSRARELRPEDEGTYFCHLGADPAVKMAVHLIVDGRPNVPALGTLYWYHGGGPTERQKKALFVQNTFWFDCGAPGGLWMVLAKSALAK